jgi:hypothetical protein
MWFAPSRPGFKSRRGKTFEPLVRARTRMFGLVMDWHGMFDCGSVVCSDLSGTDGSNESEFTFDVHVRV